MFYKNKSLMLLALSVIFASLVLTACGGGSTSAAAPTKLEVVMAEMSFTPDSIELKAGSQVDLNLVNKGALEHVFVIMKKGTTAGDHFDDADKPNVYFELPAAAGETKTGTFTAPTDPGEYQIVCSVAGHLEAGMVGKLIVK